MQTQTAAVVLPTPLPVTNTPLATPTETQPPEPTWDPNNHTVTVLRHQAPCFFGPGSSYNIESNISGMKEVELLGIGSVPGWYIIKNPYFNQPCWIAVADVQIPEGMDLSTYPVISP
jgi:hypothetical protein